MFSIEERAEQLFLFSLTFFSSIVKEVCVGHPLNGGDHKLYVSVDDPVGVHVDLPDLALGPILGWPGGAEFSVCCWERWAAMLSLISALCDQIRPWAPEPIVKLRVLSHVLVNSWTSLRKVKRGP